MPIPPFLTGFLKSIMAPLARMGWNATKPTLERRKVVTGKKLDLSSLNHEMEQVLSILSKKDLALLANLKNSCLAFLSNLDPIYDKPFIQEWLDFRETRDLFICKATDAFVGKDCANYDEPLSQLYSKYSGEVAPAATYAISTTHEYLIRSINVLFDKPSKINIQLDNTRFQQISDDIHSLTGIIEQKFDGIAEAISVENHNTRSQHIIDKEAHTTLSYTRHRQHFAEVDSFGEFLTLAERAKSGDLSSASAPIRTSIFREVARECFGKKDTPKGTDWLNEAQKLSPNEDYTLEHIRKIISTGDVDKALAEAKAIDSDDARAFILTCLLNYKNNDIAIEYYNEYIKNPSNLDGSRLLNFALKQCEAANLSFALELLASATGKHIEDCPAILSIRALVKATMCRVTLEKDSIFSSPPIHPKLAKFNDTPEKLQLRLSAIDDITSFLDNYVASLSIPKYQEFIEEMKIWLELEHPDEDIRNSHRAKFNESIRDIKFAVRHARLAFDYGKYLDISQMESYLNLQKSMGDLTFNEVIATFLIALRKDTPQATLTQLEENEETIIAVIQKEFFVSLKAEVLLKCGRRGDCEKYINDNLDILGHAKADSLKLVFFSETSEDSVAAHREAFELTKDDGDRRMLISALRDNHCYLEAAEHLDFFFNKNPSYEEAEEILFLFIRSGEYRKAKYFLSRQVVQSLIAANSNLRTLSAWVAYFNGDVQGATTILAGLPKERDPNDNNYRLAILIAQETGNWEDALGELIHAHQNRDLLSGAELVRYAGLGWLIQYPQSQVVDLLTAAATKADQANDAHSLIRVYSLATRLGEKSLEGIVANALKRAQELSGTDGPLKTVPASDLKTLIEQNRERERYITEQVALGMMPLSMATQASHGALCNVIAGQMIRNEKQNDWRHKSYIPLFAGNQERKVPDSIKTIAFDRSALIVLSHLGVLDKALDNFEQVLIANSCMTEFLEELEKIRFHQASQVTDAKLIQRLIAEQKLQIAPSFTGPIDYEVPEGLSRDLSKLVAQAKSYGGYVVLSKDEYKTTSFLEEKVDLSGIDKQLIGLMAIIDLLLREKMITEREFEQVRARHQEYCLTNQQDKTISRETSLFLDSYSLDCLIRYGLLEGVLKINKNIYIQKETQLNETGLLNYIDQQSCVENLVDEIRRIIKSNIASGKVKFIIRSEASGEDKELSLLTIFANHDGYEAVVADDRYLNKFNNNSSQRIISSLEIILFLYDNSYISEQDFIHSLQKLRRAGAIFISFAKQELVDAATKSHSQKEKSKELIELIEYLCFIGKSDVIKYPEEFYFITDGIHSCARAIKEIWAAEINTDVAREKSKYLVELINSFYLCIPANKVQLYRQLSDNVAATIVATLADIDFSSDAITGASYFKFLDDTVIKDDRYSRKYIFPYVGKMFAGAVEHVTCNMHSQNNAIPLDLIAKSCVAKIHPIIQRVMLEDADFSQKYDLVNKTIQLCGHEINYEDFMEYVRSVANNKRSVLHAIDGKRLNIVTSKIQDGTIQLNFENITSELKAGCILASSKKSRKKVLDAIKKEYNFSRMLYQKWKKKIATELTNSEYWELLDDISCLPLVALDDIDRAISTTGALDFELCIPSSEETFLALFGEPTQGDMDAFFYAAAPWQSKILLSDIDAGILKIGPGALVPSKRLLDICITSKKVFSVEALANCVSKYKDPFSLMLIFDICAALSQTDGRYVAVGEDVIHKVVKPESANEFIDFEISLHFVLPLLLQKVTLKDYPLFFQRLCAWGWAGYISRILGHYDFDRAAVLTQLKETQRNTFLITGLVERQGSPYWHPNYISSSHLSGFLYNRIISSIETFCHASTPNEWDTLLRGSENKGEISSSTLYSFYPTPFTGLSKHYGEPQSIEDISEQINKNFSELPRDEFLQTVIPFAQLSKFTSDNLDCIEMACVSLKNSLALISDDDFLNILDGLTSAAAVNRAEMIVPPIADWLITRSIEQDKKGEEFLATYTILSTFVAYQDKMEAYKFLNDKLTAIAFISKDRVQIKRSLSALKQIEEAFPELRPYLLKPKTIFTLGYYAN